MENKSDTRPATHLQPPERPNRPAEDKLTDQTGASIDTCNFVFENSSKITDILDSTPDSIAERKPVSMFRCPNVECDYKTNRSSNLRRHWVKKEAKPGQIQYYVLKLLF